MPDVDPGRGSGSRVLSEDSRPTSVCAPGAPGAATSYGKDLSTLSTISLAGNPAGSGRSAVESSRCVPDTTGVGSPGTTGRRLAVRCAAGAKATSKRTLSTTSAVGGTLNDRLLEGGTVGESPYWSAVTGLSLPGPPGGGVPGTSLA